MKLLQLREKEIVETLKKIKEYPFVLIGGYAVNAYTLPRFSVDCDIVIQDLSTLEKIKKELESKGYTEQETKKTSVSYHGNFVRYEKTLEKNFKVSVDILIKEVLDRQTHATFSASWIFENSSVKLLRGKTIFKEIKLRVVTVDALVAMKCVSCRSTDIRDIFMLISSVKDAGWIQKEIENRTSFSKSCKKIKEKILSSEFKNNLQGVYGSIDENLFEKQKKMLLALCERD